MSNPNTQTQASADEFCGPKNEILMSSLVAQQEIDAAATDPEAIVDSEEIGATLPDPERDDESEPAPAQTIQEVYGQRDLLTRMALDTGLELFHDCDQNTYATILVDEHYENWRLRSEGFRRWLRRLWQKQTGKGVGSSIVAEVVDTLDAQAVFDGAEHDVHIRVAHHQDAIYVDLCDRLWSTVEVTAQGWKVINQPPIKFVRSKGMLPLPVPAVGGRLDQLRPLINAQDESNWCLITAWLLAAFSNGPFPVLVVTGEQGSSKSFLCRILRQLIDPSIVEATMAPREPRDVMFAAQNSHVVSVDNLSGIPPWLSDLLCGISTGAAHRERRYHTNNGEEELFRAKRPTMLNGIDLAMRDDLLSRALLVSLAPIADDQRRDEKDLLLELQALAPSILGGLFDVLSSIILNLPTTTVKSKPRMADLALWVTAAETALGWDKGKFMAIYSDNREEAADLAIESDLFATTLRDLMRASPDPQIDLHWSVLLKMLEPLDKPRGWPTNAKALATRLKRLAPALRQYGVHWIQMRDEHSRFYRIWREETDVSNVSDVSESSVHKAIAADTSDDALTHEGTDVSVHFPLIHAVTDAYDGYDRSFDNTGDVA